MLSNHDYNIDQIGPNVFNACDFIDFLSVEYSFLCFFYININVDWSL